MSPVRIARALRRVTVLVAIFCGCGGGADAAHQPPSHVIEIDVDDHGLAGLWMANAPNLKGLIARGTLGFSRVVVPTHSNQNNIALLSGQYPEGDDVPANSWLSREAGFVAPIDLPGLSAGDYLFYDSNPLLVRGDSVYSAIRRAGFTSAYVGQLPPFDAGATDVHLSIVGADLGGVAVTADFAVGLLTRVLRYPQSVVGGYRFDGPAAAGESQAHFTLRDAAAFVRATSPAQPMPAFMFVWDFLALDDDPTSTFGADGAQLAQIIEDYDDGVGLLLTALSDQGLLDSTNILFTLDHGKVDTHNQVALGTHGGGGSAPADGQMAAVVAARGPTIGLGLDSYALLNEDGDAQIYARVPGAGTAAGSAAEIQATHQLLSLIQSGAIVGLDTTRTLTADGAMGTRSFHDFHASSPHQADIVVFPQDDWTLNQVDPTNTVPGPFLEHTQFPFGRHGGFSVDELYVPLILAGPAFKSGALLPHPVEHPQVPATALWTVGETRLATAERGPIAASLAGDPGETIAQPADLASARDLVLRGSGYLPDVAAAASGPAAPAVVLIDVAGLYDDEVFADRMLADAAAPLRALAATGVRFQDFWTHSRDWPVTEYQCLTGGYPVDPWVPTAEDDATETFAPGNGLLQMPPATNRVANRIGYDAWRGSTTFAPESLFSAAHDAGLTTALIGQIDFQDLHIDASAIDTHAALAGDAIGARLSDLLAATPRLFAVVAIGGARTANRHAPAAAIELAGLAATVADLAARAPGALVIVTSRGATSIDDAGSDFYGAGTSRHVPFVITGPHVRVGIVSGQPGAPVDVPATVLTALGVPASTDFALGTWATGAPVDGIPQPTPRTATAGHALVRAFHP